MKKFLGVAQPFGFGGITELLALEGALHMESKGTLSMECQDHPQFRAVTEGMRRKLSLRDESDSVGMQQYDGIISSYDTASILNGWFEDIDTFLYDGMAWFWDFDKYSDRIESILNRLRLAKERKEKGIFNQICDDLFAEDYHLTMLVAYCLADRICVRGAPQVEERLKKFPQFADKIKVVGAVIDPTLAEEDSAEEGQHILVSLSGSLAPTLTFDQNLRFSRGALRFTEEAINGWGDKETQWIFSCHPRLFEALNEEEAFRDLPPNIQVSASFPYQENLRMIRTAQAVFVSPGFSSVQEAACFQTPIFFLPEQNGGQPTGFTTLKKAGYPTDHSLTVTDEIYGGELVIGEGDMDQLYEGIDRLWSDEFGPLRQQKIDEFRRVILDARSRTKLVAEQHEAVREMIGGFNGAREAIHFFLKEMES